MVCQVKEIHSLRFLIIYSRKYALPLNSKAVHTSESLKMDWKALSCICRNSSASRCWLHQRTKTKASLNALFWVLNLLKWEVDNFKNFFFSMCKVWNWVIYILNNIPSYPHPIPVCRYLLLLGSFSLWDWRCLI